MLKDDFEAIAVHQGGHHDPPGSLPALIHARLKKKTAAWLAGLAPGSRVLDLGCGSGDLSLGLSRLRPDFQVTGVDESAAMLEVAAKAGAGPGWIQADGLKLPFADREFDAVVVFDVLGNLDPASSAPALLGEARRVGKKWLLVELKTPWTLSLLLKLRGLAGGLPAKVLGLHSAQASIPVFVHKMEKLFPGATPSGFIRPWFVLPAPSYVAVFDLETMPQQRGPK